MNWDAIGAIAEMVGALSVIASIIYLAYQIRQNTLSNRITAMQNTTDQFTSFGNLMIENRETRETWSKGRKSMQSLSPSEMEVFHYINLNLCWYYSSQYFQYLQGAMDEVEWAQSLGLIQSSWLEYPGTQEWWRDRMDQRRVTVPFYELITAEIEAIQRNA